jgi:hypothetical protein
MTKTIIFKSKFEKKLKKLRIKTKFMKNVKKYVGTNFSKQDDYMNTINKNANSWHKFIVIAFIWRDTPEKDDFWRKIANS